MEYSYVFFERSEEDFSETLLHVSISATFD